MLEKILSNYKNYLEYFFSQLNLAEAEKILKIFQNCSGTLFFSGVGKSGYVAKKIAVTMTSTGTKALFLSPVDALHGDIGIVSPGDVFVMLSKSGESEELLNLIPYLRNKGITLVGIVSNPKSRLCKACDTSICLPLKRELCSLDMVPTTSTTIQMIFGDTLAVAMMEYKSFNKNDYALNHPAGSIGKRIMLKVRDLMLTGDKIPLCRPDDKLINVLVELSKKQCGCVLITNQDLELLGIFTDGDLRRGLQSKKDHILETSMSQIMTTAPKWISPDVLVMDAIYEMESDQKHPITVLPVLDENHKVLGIIKMHDIVQSGI